MGSMVLVGKPVFLIAEDDPDDQFLIRSVANEVCAPETKMHFVEDGIALLDYLQQNKEGSSRPDLILLDLNMPRRDGRQVLKDIKNDPELAMIPTVIMTTSNRDEDVNYCHSLGIQGFFRKPGPIAELREIIRKLCEEFLPKG